MSDGYFRDFKNIIILCSTLGIKVWADFSPALPNQIHPVLSAQLKSGGQAWSSSEFPLSQSQGKIARADFRRLWEGLGNSALRYRLNGNEQDLIACRKSLMALSSYAHWFELDNELSDDESVWPVVQMLYAKAWLSDSLPRTERELLRGRCHLQLLKYETIIDGEQKVSWWPVSNHPELLPHLVAMALLAKDEEGHDDSLARKVLDEVVRQFRRYTNLADLQIDGGEPFRVSQGIIADWSRLILGPLLSSLYKDEDTTERWARRRASWYDAIVLPGQSQIWSDEGLKSDSPTAEIIPVLYGLAAYGKDEKIQHFALEINRKLQKSWSPWLFLSAGYALPTLKEDVDHHSIFQNFPSQGWLFGRENRRIDGAHFSFHCGNPLGDSWHQAWLQGRPDLEFSHALPDQGSWTWRLQNRVILGVALHRNNLSTQHYNTLTIGGEGQLFEGYPRYQQEKLAIPRVGGQLLVNERYGNSWLMLGEFSQSYSSHVDLEKFYRAILWLSPNMMIQLDHVTCKKAKKLSFAYHSPDYPLTLRGGGFYQKVSGVQFRTGSFPQGEWTIDYLRDEQNKDVACAKETVVSSQWDRCCLITPMDVQQDAWMECLLSGIHMDFYKSQYKLEYNFSDGVFKLKMQVGDKTFFDIMQKLEN